MVKNISVWISLAACGGVIAQQETQYLHKVFSTPTLRSEFTQFLDNVLRQVPSKEFFKLIDANKRMKETQQDSKVYKMLQTKSHKVKPWLPVFNQLKALKHQKTVLTEQVQQLLGQDTKKIHGCVEIGSPGTYCNSLKKHIPITGKIYAVNDKKRASDYMQAFTFNLSTKFLPYNQFVPLHNYDPITEEAIPSSSVDLILCFIGLHHVPKEKLDSFVDSLSRILRPGGMLLLREHDACNQEVMSLIYAAHSVYNVLITNESIHAEGEEYRNFQALPFWVELLERHGFQLGSERLLQKGDPTRNTLLKCTKLARSEDEKLEHIHHTLKQKPGYHRDIIQTYLSAPEWMNVDQSQDYGEYIEHTPFYQYPYFKSIQSYWSVFKNSWQAAAEKKGNMPVLTSPYTLMNVFIGVATTLEYSVKGLVSMPIKWAYAGTEPSMIKVLVKDPQNEIERVDKVTVSEVYVHSPFKLVEMPRYKEFIRVMQKLEDTAIDIMEIAGQKEIQCKVRYQSGNEKTFPQVTGCKKEYEWHLPTKPEYTYAALTVEVPKLKEILRELKKHNVEILYLHDF